MSRCSTSSGAKGFYFSFDAILAFTVMAASLAIVSQSSILASGSYEASSAEYQKANLEGKDAMKLASSQTFNSFEPSFRQELIDNTVMESGDMDRTVVDGLTLMWAARNFSYASEASRRYFDDKVPEGYGYRLQVTNNGNTRIIYETSSIPEDASAVTSISRLVSGHQIDRPSEGFQARARATSITKNETKVIPVPPMGMAPQNSKMEVNKRFYLNSSEDIRDGKFYLSVHYSGASYFEQFRINNNQYGQNAFNWVHEDDAGSGSAAYGTLDITDDLQQGENEIYLRMKGGNSYNSHFHPGTKIEVKYSSDEKYEKQEQLRHRRIELENILSDASGSSESGVFSVKEFTVPKDAEFLNASYELRADYLDSECGYYSWYYGRQPGWDVQVNLNEQPIMEECASGNYSNTIEIPENQVRNGTNVVTTFIESKGDTRWGGDRTALSSYPKTNASHIDLWYRLPENQLRFGEIEVTASEQLGGGVEVPKEYKKSFQYGELQSADIYIGQLFSTNPEVLVDNGASTQQIFESQNPRSAPTSIYIEGDRFITSNENRLILDDIDASPERAYVPESTFAWTVWTDSQVGYGKLFENRSAALNDAEKRLENVLGPFVNSTGIETGTLATGNQPYLWGPASVKLVVWDE